MNFHQQEIIIINMDLETLTDSLSNISKSINESMFITWSSILSIPSDTSNFIKKLREFNELNILNDRKLQKKFFINKWTQGEWLRIEDKETNYQIIQGEWWK